MALQYSTTLRNARLDQIETVPGTSPVLRMLTGSVPANPAAAETGTIVFELTLPSDWMAAASGGSKAMSGTWEDLSANNAGTMTYFRIYNSGLTTCHVQGTVGVGSGDLQVDNNVVLAGQAFSITSFTITEGNP